MNEETIDTEIVLDGISSTRIAEFDEFKLQLQEFKAKYDDVVYDLDDEKQEKQARADRLVIGKVISKLDKAHRAKKAPMEVGIKLLDSDRKEIKDGLLDVQTKIKDQLKVHDEKLIRHCAKLQGMIDAINEIAIIDIDDSVTTTERLKLAKECLVDDSFENREADGHMAKAKTIETLEALLALEEKRAIEASELKAKEEAEAKSKEDERIKAALKVAEEKAKKDTELAAKKAKQDKKLAIEKVEKDKKDAINLERENAKLVAKKAESEKKAALEKAKQEKQDAIDAERENAEKAKIKAENEKQAAIAKAQKEANDKQNKIDEEVRRKTLQAESEAAELKKKQDNKEHQRKINKEAVNSLLSLTFMNTEDNKFAQDIIKAIISKQVKNVFIQY